jgi:predicted nucleic acid-binding protein
MPFAAVLDASVLYPLPLRDTLLRMAEAEPYDLRWSDQILDEVTLVADRRATDTQARRLIEVMTDAFDGAAVPHAAIEKLEASMTNHPKDRHVLAAAVAGDAQAVVSLNLRHFPPEACEAFAVEALHPDEFLLDLYSLAPRTVHAALTHQAATLRRPPMTLSDLLDRLAPTAPSFAEAVRTDLSTT